jgi:hypothetical protein
VTTISPLNHPPAGTGPASGRPSGRLRLTPGRRVALLLGVPVVLTIIAYNGYDLVLNTGEGSFPVHDVVPVVASGLTVNLGGGAATVRGGAAAAGAAVVSGRVTYHLGRPSVHQEAGDIGLDCPWFDEGNCSLDATVAIPSGTALTMTTGGGDLTASGLTAGTTLHTDGGNITLSDTDGPLSLTSSGGDVAVSNVKGNAATIFADGGNINGTGVDIPSFVATSSGGDVTLTLTAIPSDLQVSADGGNVTIIVPRGHYDVSYKPDGGSVNSSVKSYHDSQNVITLASDGGDISLSES